MKTDLYLTSEEQKQFQTLTPALQDGWKVLPEEQTKYESMRQIMMRYQLADFTMQPEMKLISEKIAKGESIDDFSFENLPDDVQNELYYVLGARGVNALMQGLFANLKTDEDVEALAVLSTVRHKLLEINASTTHV